MEQSNWVKRSFPTFIRLLRRGLQVVIVIIIVLVIVHTTLNVVLHRRVSAKLAEIRRTGGAVTLSELISEPVPHEQNADVYYSYAFSVMQRALAEDERCREEIVGAFEILWPRAMTSQEWLEEAKREPDAPPKYAGFQQLMARMKGGGTKGKRVAAPSRSERQQREPAIEAADALRVAGLSRSERQQRERAIEAAREYLRRVQPGVDSDGREIEIAARHIFRSENMVLGLQVVKDAREFDQTQLLSEYDLGPDVVASSILPRMARFRVLSRWVGSAAVLAARDEDIDEAFNLISAQLHIASSLRHEPMLITQLVRVAIGGLAFDAMQKVLDENYPPDEHVPMVVAELDKLRSREPFARALEAEQCSILAHDRQLMAASYVARPFRLLDQSAYLEYMPQLIDLAVLPSCESRDALEKLEDELSGLSKLKVSARLVIPAASRALETQDRLVAQCDLAEMAMYLKQYKRRTGSYPEKLDAIVPECIQELPVDPFTGTPYIYRKEAEGFVMYSVGVNVVDDGGKSQGRAGDIVWRSRR
jgi:hypothetical protein